MTEHVDVLIVGAGLSGVGAGARLGQEHPHRSYLVLEAREASGGTWDLFRYPGIRSDSDMFTMGYRFRPWRSDRTLADGAAILDYVRATAREQGVEERIRYRHEVVAADWDSAAGRWTVTAATPQGAATFTASFLWACSGYYHYDDPHVPEFRGTADYTGTVVHPQHWPAGLVTAGKRVVVIGSGATAVTLVPALADTGAAHVTMLQRTPSYVLALPGVDPVARFAQRWLPAGASHAVTRWKNILVTTATYRFARRWPDAARRVVRSGVARQLPDGYPVDVHFRPSYDPWDQRVCFVPDGDLFRVIREGRAEVVTDTVETFTEQGLRLASGEELTADVVVTATGFDLRLMGDIALSLDGERVDLRERMAYRALMLGGIPNFAYTIGYTNASWTLKADLVADFVCRVLGHLDRTRTRTVVPVPDPTVRPTRFLDLDAGYVRRSLHLLPQQGDREPWRLRQSYLHDVRSLRRGKLEDGVLRFS